MKRCKKCGQAKEYSAFYREKGCADGYRPECKSCNLAARKMKYREDPKKEIARVRAWQEKNRDHVNEYQRRYRTENRDVLREGHLRRTFGLTLEGYARLVDAQGGGCAICGDGPLDGQSLHVDHRGEVVRGALCVRCNNGLGQFKDEPELLFRAADYVVSGGFVPPDALELRDAAIARARMLVGASG
jgi:hypothetical protein